MQAVGSCVLRTDGHNALVAGSVGRERFQVGDRPGSGQPLVGDGLGEALWGERARFALRHEFETS